MTGATVDRLPEPTEEAKPETDDGATAAEEEAEAFWEPRASSGDSGNKAVGWAQLEELLQQAFQQLEQKMGKRRRGSGNKAVSDDSNGTGSGLVRKVALRQEVLQAGMDLVTRGVASRQRRREKGLREKVDKLWRRLDGLYGQLAFADLSWEEVCLGLAACKGRAYDPRTVYLPLLRPTSSPEGTEPSGNDNRELSFGCRVAFTEIFRRFDSDHDGALSKAELNAFQRSVHGVPLDAPTLDWIFANHQLDSHGALTLRGFLRCVHEQAVENESAIVWELTQLGYTTAQATDADLMNDLLATTKPASAATVTTSTHATTAATATATTFSSDAADAVSANATFTDPSIKGDASPTRSENQQMVNEDSGANGQIVSDASASISNQTESSLPVPAPAPPVEAPAPAPVKAEQSSSSSASTSFHDEPGCPADWSSDDVEYDMP
eukprot:SAG31_NODE_2424_length_5724_cov_35.068978_3_plen_438_part_00